MTRQSKKPESIFSQLPVLLQSSRSKPKKHFTIIASLVVLSIALTVSFIKVLADDNGFLTEIRAMSTDESKLSPRIPIKQIDVQPSALLLSSHKKDSMVPFSPEKRFVKAKVQDKDTDEPILLTEALITLKMGGESRDGESLHAGGEQQAEKKVIESNEIEETIDSTHVSEPCYSVSEKNGSYTGLGIITGDDGTVHFEMPDDLSGSGYVTMSAPGYKMKTLPVSVSEGEYLDLGVVYLEEEWNIYGTVTDHSGNPIADAEVTGSCSRSCFRKSELVEETIEHQKKTDSEGNFSFSSKDDFRDQWFPQTIGAKAAGYQTRFIDKVKEKTLPIEIALAEGRNIRGRVLWSFDESPIAGIRLICLEKKCRNATLLKTVTDKEGRFELSGFPAQDSALAINISHPTRSPDLVVTVPKYTNEIGDIVVEGPVSVGVTVVEKGSDNFVNGAKVHSGPIGFNFKTQFTDDLGCTIFTGIPSGKEFDFSARAHGFFIERKNNKKIITGTPGSRHDLEISLKKVRVVPEKFTVYGKAVNKLDNPISNAEIKLCSYSGESVLYPSERKNRSGASDRKRQRCNSCGITESSGSFEIRMNDQRCIETIIAEHPRYAPFRMDGTFLNGTSDREFSITMKEIDEWFYGTVNTDEESPVSGASVEIEYRYFEGKECGLDHRYNYTATSDSSGIFALPYFPMMKFTLAAWTHEDKSRRLAGFSDEELVPGTHCVALVLSTKDNGYLNFECRRASGEALVDFYIGVENAGTEVTDYQGKAGFKNLVNQTHYFSLHDPHSIIGMYGYGINPLKDKDRKYKLELVPGRFVEVDTMMCIDDQRTDLQPTTITLVFEEQRGDTWVEAADKIRDVNDNMIEWKRRIDKGDVYTDAITGDLAVSFVTFLDEGVFRVKLNADGYQEVLSEPFTITEHSETLQLNFNMNPQ